jgi:hypothetical protein
MSSPNRPSAWLYVLGVVLTFGGCGTSCGMNLWQSQQRVQRLQRLVMPGAHELALAPGKHVLYAESRSTVDGTAYVWHGGALPCELVRLEGNQPVPLASPSASESYSFGGYEGQSMFTFEVAAAGRHRLTCRVETGAPMVMALSRGHVLGSMIYSTLGGFLVSALGLFTIFLTRDRRRQNELHEQHQQHTGE